MADGSKEQYSEVINALTIEAIQCSPASWTSGVLSIDCDGSAINYKLKNDESEDRATLSDQLRMLLWEIR